jgi:hypothetical protein
LIADDAGRRSCFTNGAAKNNVETTCSSYLRNEYCGRSIPHQLVENFTRRKTTRTYQTKALKIPKNSSNVLIILVTAAAALFVAGCAGVGSGNTTALLSAAGFRAHTPQTPKQQQMYAALPPY